MYLQQQQLRSIRAPRSPKELKEARRDNRRRPAGLSAACFLVRDAQMPGENITIMEDMP